MASFYAPFYAPLIPYTMDQFTMDQFQPVFLAVIPMMFWDT